MEQKYWDLDNTGFSPSCLSEFTLLSSFCISHYFLIPPLAPPFPQSFSIYFSQFLFILFIFLFQPSVPLFNRFLIFFPLVTSFFFDLLNHQRSLLVLLYTFLSHCIYLSTLICSPSFLPTHLNSPSRPRFLPSFHPPSFPLPASSFLSYTLPRSLTYLTLMNSSSSLPSSLLLTLCPSLPFSL